MDLQRIAYSVSGQIAHITLDAPESMNAIDPLMAAELVTTLQEAADDAQVRVVLLSGAGRAFCAGGDIASFESGVDMTQLSADLARSALLLRTMPKPVVASVHRAAAGAGMALALLADFCIAAEDTRFATAFVRLGLVSDTGLGFVLTRTLGHVRAADLLMTGRTLSANQALDLGLITEVVPVDSLSRATVDFIGGLVAGPAGAFAGIKEQIRACQFEGFTEYLGLETRLQAERAASPDFTEGLTAFREKRPPNFTG
ncbi:MAG: enoyl-CoA hydratase/isomerase family protein [Brooklawnia sp.]|jgi:enoyl-CoA hydratase/carnithine racemase